MIRVYLDWNIFTSFKKEVEPYKSMLTLIESNENNLMFPYSPAHLSDLLRGYNNSDKAISETNKDLTLLGEISKNRCLNLNAEKKSVSPEIVSPSIYFQELLKDRTENYDFDELFHTENDQAVSIMKSAPSGIDVTQLNELKEFLPNLQNEDSLYSLIKDFVGLMNSPSNQSKIYKNSRELTKSTLKVKTNPKEWGNAFDYIDKTLEKANWNKTFREYVEEQLKITNKDKPSSTYDYFVKYYVTLDSFGYHGDKKLANLIDDANHAFYAAHCDVFVTEDVNTYHKTKAIYEHFNISTKVIKADEFTSTFYSLSGLSDVTFTLPDKIIEILSNSFILKKTMDDEFNQVEVYKIPYPLVHYFNRMQISFYKENTTIFFYKKRDHYSTFMFWNELKTIVDKIVSELGVDLNFRSEFNIEKEKKEVLEEKWLGRRWEFGSKTFEIVYTDSLFGLGLKIVLNDLKN